MIAFLGHALLLLVNEPHNEQGFERGEGYSIRGTRHQRGGGVTEGTWRQQTQGGIPV